jgi:uncharacterized protein (TIGR03435 family)
MMAEENRRELAAGCNPTGSDGRFGPATTWRVSRAGIRSSLHQAVWPAQYPGVRRRPGSSDPGLYRFGLATLLDLIATAYNVEYFQVSSAVPLDRKNFDLTAKVPVGATKEQFRAMLQSFLTDRFHLKLHIQSREFPAYELVVANTGPKLNRPADKLPAGYGWPELRPDRPGMAARGSFSGGFNLIRLKAQQQPLSALDFTLEYTLGLPVTTPDGIAESAIALDLSGALQKQLGLQLVRKKVPFDVLVIDKVDPLPTEN